MHIHLMNFISFQRLWSYDFMALYKYVYYYYYYYFIIIHQNIRAEQYY